MGSLAQKVDTIREQLGLVDGRPLAASVDEAVFQLGLADQVKGFNLVQKADACLTALGTSSASAAAAAVAPSASAAAESVVLMGLPAGADQAPIAQKMGRAAEELGTYTQPAVAPAPQEIARAPKQIYASPYPSYGQPAHPRPAAVARAADPALTTMAPGQSRLARPGDPAASIRAPGQSSKPPAGTVQTPNTKGWAEILNDRARARGAEVRSFEERARYWWDPLCKGRTLGPEETLRNRAVSVRLGVRARARGSARARVRARTKARTPWTTKVLALTLAPPHPRPITQPHAHPNRSHAPLGGSRSSSTASGAQVYLPIPPHTSLYLLISP